MSSENEQLYSSEDEDRHPRKFFKTKSTHNICHPSFLAGTSQQVWGIVNNPTQNKYLADSTHTNQDIFLNPTSNLSKKPLDVLGDDPFELLIQTLKAQLEIQPGKKSKWHAATVYLLANIAQKVESFIEANSVSHIANLDSQSNTSHLVFGANNFVWTKPPKDFIHIMLHQLLISTDVESYTKGTDSESRNNIQNKPKEWKLKYLPISFCTEENEAHSIILKNILVQEGNPEQQIPRLIELAKLLLEWAAPKGTSYSNKEIKEKFRDKNIQHIFLKKMVSKIDFSMVVLATDKQVEQELIKDLDSSQNNGFTSEE
ncbi:hypothetical protein PPACK8108_LOCUS2561 [Phakopsora pachyrhizi]|uniref:Uncharacterized protein n=1 Tax=Phakopsora pachyrhizi TaxID=170000 RepID=A0AAV0AL49_PHAPC|nr:hypothetical protein PPACK8108_LOCUS2561 [Phakopsora pachyrhizi]